MPALLIGAVNTGTEQLTITGHGLNTGDGPVTPFTLTGTIPTGLAALTNYWVIRDDANTIRLATSSANAMAGTAVNITSTGSGTLFLVHGLPYRRPRTYVALSQLKSDDLNAIFDSFIAFWAWRSGQAVALPEASLGLWSGMRMRANEHVELSGTGAYKHGTTTMMIPADAFVPDGANAHSYAHGRSVNGIANNAGTAPAFRAKIELPIGKRIQTVRVLARDVSGTTLIASVNSLVASTNANSVLGTSATSPGSGAFQTLSVTGLSAVVAVGVLNSIRIAAGAGTGACTIHGAEVDFDHP